MLKCAAGIQFGTSLRGAIAMIGTIAMLTALLSPTAGAQQTALITGNHSPSIERFIAPRPAPAAQLLELSIALNPTNRATIDTLIAAQQNPASPDYHHWLKPGEFDRRFGPDASVRSAIVQWLTKSGFTVKQANGNAWTIRFSGTVLQAEQAFGVEINSMDGGKHFANMKDPSVPVQFADAIGFIDGLDNLRGQRNPMHIAPGSPADEFAATAMGTAPAVKLNGQTGFAPSDFYTFYDAKPLLKAGINGSGGGCIGVIEVSDYMNAGIASFDKTFNLAAAKLTRVIPADSDNPGLNSRAGETTLDIEYSHMMAPGAPISVYIADPATFGGNSILATVDALNTAVNQPTCTALSISIESCGQPSSFFTGALHTTYAKAAAQGQTVFVAEGDEGAAEFDFDPTTGKCVVGTSRNVNELASDQYVTSIGGTQFQPNYNSKGADVGFVAESVWDEPNPSNPAIGSGGGGQSKVWPKPSFQNSGTPADGVRDVPDISMEAACSTPGAFSVFPASKSPTKVQCCACGTSLGAPVWAGIARLMVQANGQHPLGSINPQLYELGNRQDTPATGIRDVTLGNNDYNGVTGFDAGTGYDLVSGWGTPDVTTLVSAFVATDTINATLTFTPAKLKFRATPDGTTSKPLLVTIKNVSKGVLVAIASQSALPPFAVSSQCGETLLPGKSCKVKVTFSPTDTVSHTALLSIFDNVTGAPQTVSLTGTGKAPR
ncbi:MAG TPA: protease pro-enzyme activation domain-containing protein [Candidatus Binataceae bacterium]|nr:protease pro-enzyme activation domain-containing protein [Candidatus Binataceae bacterium]